MTPKMGMSTGEMVIMPVGVISVSPPLLFQGDQWLGWSHNGYNTHPCWHMNCITDLCGTQCKQGTFGNDPAHAIRDLWASDARHSVCPETQIHPAPYHAVTVFPQSQLRGADCMSVLSKERAKRFSEPAAHGCSALGFWVLEPVICGQEGGTSQSYVVAWSLV